MDFLVALLAVAFLIYFFHSVVAVIVILLLAAFALFLYRRAIERRHRKL